MSAPLPPSYWQRLRSSGQGNGLRAQLLRGGVGSIALKLTHAVLMIVVAVMLARALGPDSYGAYAFVYALINVLALPATMGLPQLIVRETAKAKSQANWGLMRGLWRWSSSAALVFGLAIAGCTLLVLIFFGDNMSSARVNTLLAGLVMVPLIALARLRDGALRGLGRVVLGQIAESAVRPGVLIGLIFAAAFGSGWLLSAPAAMALHAVAAGVAFIVGATLLQRNRPAELRARIQPIYHSRAWLSAATPLAMTAGMNLINQHADTLLLGFFRSDSEVGVYRVVTQGAMLVAFGLQAAELVAQPHLARLYAKGEHAKLQRLVTQSARAVFAIATPVAVLYIFFGRELLSIVFGAEYSNGYQALAVLAIGQLINAMAGSVGALLNMTGFERDTMRGIMVGAAVNVVLNILLIPQYGATGAAVATAISLATWKILLWRFARQRLGIRSTAFGF